LSSPAIIDDRVYVSDATLNFYCLTAASGSTIWSYYIGGGHGRTPAVADGRVCFGVGILNSATLCCLDAADGSHIWDFVTGNHNILSSPAIYDEKVYFGTMGQVEHDLDYYVYCLDAVGNGDGTTDMIWSYQLDDWVQSSPAIYDGKVYIGSHDHNVYCLDATDGSFIWSYTTGDTVSSSPAVYDGKVYVGSYDDNVYCLDATDGSYIWSYTASDAVSTSPAIADGKVYVATYYGNVYCLDATDGDYIWSYTTGDEVWYSPSIADGKVYIGSKDHYVYCFGEEVVVPDPDLDCEGSLSWTKVEPGATVTGSFKVKNIGEPESELDWEVESNPEWGDWTFSPSNGDDLTPEAGPLTVNVEVVAPDEGDTEFEGEIKVVNKNNPDDFDTIPVYLKTPRNKNVIHTPILQFLQRFIQRFPFLEQILSFLFHN